MVKSDFIWRDVTITFLFLQATNEHLPKNNKNNDGICRYISNADIKSFYLEEKNQIRDSKSGNQGGFRTVGANFG